MTEAESPKAGPKGKDRKIGTLGAGMVGRAFAAAALKLGHDVMLSNSRTPDTLFTLRAVLNCKIGSPQEAAAFGDIVQPSASDLTGRTTQ